MDAAGRRQAAVPSPRAQADLAVELAFTDPGRARLLAGSAIAAAGGEVAATSAARQALGLASAAVGELVEARRQLVAAVAVADRAGRPDCAGEARGSLGYVLALLGRPAQALREIDRAISEVTGVSGARLRMQRGLVLEESGRFAEAEAAYAAALLALDGAGGDPLLLASVLNNRSIVRVRLGDWRNARADLDGAERLYAATGHHGRIAMVSHNRGLAAALLGDIPAALLAFEDAARRYRAAGRDSGLLEVEHAETLLSVGLATEARRMAELAVARFTSSRNAIDLVQARVVLARAALAGADPAIALEQATRARRAARGQQRPGWAALAGYLALRARWQAGRCSPASLRAGQAVVTALRGSGWTAATVDARLTVARMALRLGRVELARQELAAAARARTGGPVQARVAAWHAAALLRHSRADGPGAELALRRGLGVLEEFRAGLGATELRVHTAAQGQQLAQFGIRLAMATGRADSVLWWAEQWRAGAAWHQRARPPQDARLAEALARLRQVTLDLAGALSRGGDPRPLLRRQTELEATVRRVARLAGPSAGGPRPAPGDPAAAVTPLLDGAALIEYVQLDDDLHAVVVTGSGCRLRSLGPLGPVLLELERLLFSLRTLAHGAGPAPLLAAAGARLEGAAGELARLLLGPLAEWIEGRPLVIVPTGALHGLPWPALPPCRGRPVSVVPSAALWQRAATAAAPQGRCVAMAGPGLAHAAAEAAAVARLHPGALRFTGRRATARAALAAMGGAAVVHIAAHGRLRADNPQFSSVLLADGPLTVYDLEALCAPPGLVVLSACDSGRTAVHPGDELVGLSAALLAMGTRGLVAALVPVRDDTTRSLMGRFHRSLRAGHRPAAALARAQAELAEDPAVAGFQCFGAC